MTDSENTPEQDGIPGAWARIWTGALLGFLSVFILLASADSYDDRPFWLFLSAVAGFFGLLHFLVGCVMHALDLHARLETASAEKS